MLIRLPFVIFITAFSNQLPLYHNELPVSTVSHLEWHYAAIGLYS